MVLALLLVVGVEMAGRVLVSPAVRELSVYLRVVPLVVTTGASGIGRIVGTTGRTRPRGA